MATIGDDAPPWRPDPRPLGRADLLAVAVWTCAVVLFFWDAVTLQKALFYFDITEINYPYRAFLADEIRSGRFSKWMPGLYCGMPLYSESQAGYWHPLKYVLYPFLTTWKAFNLDSILSVWITGLAAYGWLRRHVSPIGALTGGALFGFSGFTWSHFIHTSMINGLPSVPLAFWALECAWSSGRTRALALGGLALACQVFAGHLQDTILTGMALGLYALYRAATEPTWKARIQALGMASLLVTIGVLIAAVQWIPSKELIDRTPRSNGLSWRDMTHGSWHPELLPTLLVREMYGTRAGDTDWMDGFYPWQEMDTTLGVIGLALAVIGASARRDRWVAFWVILAGIAILMMLGRFTFLMDVFPHIPILGSGRIPVRYHLWLVLATSALAAVGADRLARPGGVPLKAVAIVFGVLVLASAPVLAYVYAPVWTDAGRWATAYHVQRYRWLGEELALSVSRTVVLGLAAWMVAAWARRTMDVTRRARIAAALPLLLIAELLGSHLHEVPTIDPSFWTLPPATARYLKLAPGVIRVAGLGVLSAGEPGFATRDKTLDFFRARETLAWSLPPVWGLKTSTGITPIISRRYLSYADNAKFGEGRLDVESVSHLITGPSKGIPGWEPPIRIGSAAIHRNPNVQPRARLMGRPIYVADEAAAVASMLARGAEIRDRVIIEDRSRPLDPAARVEGGSAAILRDEPEHVEIKTDTPVDSYLVLADLYDPGWSATLDDEPVPIRHAQVAFRGVFVPRGSHTIVFSYRPAGFTLGLIVTSVGVGLALIAVAWPRAAATLNPEHAPNDWPRGWLRIEVGLIVLVLLLSTVAIRDGHFTTQRRWDGSWHRFTWGAKIEAMHR